jgi:hypothetical protein
MHIAFKNLKQLMTHPLKNSITTLRKAASGLYYAPAALFAKWKLNRLEKA